MQTLSNSEVAAAGLADWRKLAQAVHARFVATDPVLASAFVAAVVTAAGDHHVDVHLSGSVVDVSTSTREDGRWVTSADLDLARTISAVAAEQGLTARPGEVAQLEAGLDTFDDERIGPFWAAVLTGDAANRIHDSVFDPTDRVPGIWFQGTDEHETPRQRWHFDLWLAPEVADGRIAAAVAAGGTVVDAGAAPSFTVLADPDGNRVCICTSEDRG